MKRGGVKTVKANKGRGGCGWGWGDGGGRGIGIKDLFIGDLPEKK